MRAVQLAAVQCTGGSKLLEKLFRFWAVNGSNFLAETRTGINFTILYCTVSFICFRRPCPMVGDETEAGWARCVAVPRQCAPGVAAGRAAAKHLHGNQAGFSCATKNVCGFGHQFRNAWPNCPDVYRNLAARHCASFGCPCMSADEFFHKANEFAPANLDRDINMYSKMPTAAESTFLGVSRDARRPYAKKKLCSMWPGSGAEVFHSSVATCLYLAVGRRVSSIWQPDI